MRIYIHDEKTGGRLVEASVQRGIEVLTPAMVAEQEEPMMQHLSFLDQVDAVVLEITKPTRDAQFILAQTILAQKPTLCLYAKNQAPRDLLSLVRQRGGRALKTFSYTQSTLEDALVRFVQRYDPQGDQLDDEPSIKYTLRLSPRLDRYLTWRAEQNDGSKATVIRQMLQDVSDQDSEYEPE